MKLGMDICSYYVDELAALFKEKGEPAFRAKQLYDWLHNKRVRSFDEMSNLPQKTRQWLSDEYRIPVVKLVRKQVSKDGTEKYLFGFADGNCVETVAMEYEHGLAVCVSTQVGCRMGCKFCASTQNGLVRSLTAGEILQEVYETEKVKGEVVDSVVLMGIGEPLDNMDNVLRFYDIVTDQKGYGLKNRSVTLSTCGITPKIYELAEKKKQLTLVLSLHEAFSEKRSEIMPINKAYPLEQVVAACRDYVKTTGRRVSFEYTLIHGFNDSDEDAEKLASLMHGFQSHVNVIPVNSAGRGNFEATRAEANGFAAKLTRLGVNATVRRTLGDDISAACGQLRRDVEQENVEKEQQ